MAGGGIKINNNSIRGGADGITYTPRIGADGLLYFDPNRRGYNSIGGFVIKGEDGRDGVDGLPGRDGAKGEKGATGAKLVAMVPDPANTGDGNKYTMYFDDGTVAEFVAPRGEKGADGKDAEIIPTLDGNEPDKAPSVQAVNKEFTSIRVGVPKVDTIEEMTDTDKKYALSTDEYYVYAFSQREPYIFEDIPFEEGKTLNSGGVTGDQSGSGTTDYIPVDVVTDDGVFVGFQLFTNENDGIFRNNTVPRFALYDKDKNCLSYRSGSTTLAYVVETFDGVKYKGVWLSKSFFSYYGTEVIGARYVRVTVATTTGDYKSHPHNFITAYKASWMRETPEWKSVPPYVPKMASETEAGLVRVWTTTNEDGTIDLHIDTTEQGA